MFTNSIHAATIGQKAYQILSGSPQFIIRGITSRGIFLDATNDWIVFLSEEQYCGPLTININKLPSNKSITVNSHVHLAGNILSFENTISSIDISNARIYSTPQLTAFKPLMKNPFPQLSIPNTHPLSEEIAIVNKALQTQHWDMVKETCISMYGHGTGLTPEGDDFVLGFLYGLGQSQVVEQKRIKTMLEHLIHAATLKTTTLSANLIECAAQGQVDERIHAAFHAIIDDTPDQEKAIIRLLGWGNTSGKMVLAGMMATLSMVNHWTE